jgi:quinol monooxygenase YgiN
MSSKPLTVVATVKAKAGKVDVVRRELLALVPTTRQEPGCLNYDLHEAVDDPGTFLFHENWTSKKHLDEHLARPHLQALLGQAADLFREPPQITLWTRIS